MASKQWIVGYFEGENKYSVIPESWLILCGKMYISKWPKSGNIPRMISECTESEIDWPTYPVKVVSRFYNNYKEASKNTYNNVAKMLIERFVSEYSTHYGEEYVSYNVHGLIHVADFVMMHGSLDTFSAFKYENYLQFLKKSCKNARFPLEDTYNRIMEHIDIDTSTIAPNYPILKNEINYDPLVNRSIDETYYKEIILNNYVLNSTNLKDNFVYIKDHGIVKVINIIQFSNGIIKIEAIKYNIFPMFQNPISSDIIKMYYIHDIIPKPPLISIDIESIKYKCFSFPISNNKSIAMALLHTT